MTPTTDRRANTTDRRGNAWPVVSPRLAALADHPDALAGAGRVPFAGVQLDPYGRAGRCWHDHPDALAALAGAGRAADALAGAIVAGAGRAGTITPTTGRPAGTRSRGRVAGAGTIAPADARQVVPASSRQRVTGWTMTPTTPTTLRGDRGRAGTRGRCDHPDALAALAGATPTTRQRVGCHAEASRHSTGTITGSDFHDIKAGDIKRRNAFALADASADIFRPDEPSKKVGNLMRAQGTTLPAYKRYENGKTVETIVNLDGDNFYVVFGQQHRSAGERYADDPFDFDVLELGDRVARFLDDGGTIFDTYKPELKGDVAPAFVCESNGDWTVVHQSRDCVVVSSGCSCGDPDHGYSGTVYSEHFFPIHG